MTACLRERSAVEPSPPSSSGRSPAKAPTTSERCSGRAKAADTTSSRKPISVSVGSGTSGTGPGAGSSVSPTYTVPSGWGSTMTNRLVSPGTGAKTLARSSGTESARSTRWVPRLGRRRMPSVRLPSSPRTWSAQTPAALMIARARTTTSSSVVSSRSRTSPWAAESTRARVRTWAPCSAAVRASVMTRRASSSSWPSQPSSPPRRPAGRRDGAIARVSVAERWRGPGRVSASVRAPRRSRSPARSPARDSPPCSRDIEEVMGMSIGMERVRCGAVTSMRMPRSTALSWATPTCPLAR